MNDNKNFLDPKMIGTLVVIAGFWMAWSYYMDLKYPHKDVPAVATQNVQTTAPTTVAPTQNAAANLQVGTPPQAATAADKSAEILTDYSSPEFNFQISSRGMGFKISTSKIFEPRESAHRFR